MERKVFIKNEIGYLNFALTAVGCYGVNENKEEYQCPYWDWELKNEEGKGSGDCSIKHSQKLCILLKVVESGELSLVLRDKTSEDNKKEAEYLEQTIQKKEDLLEQEIIERQQRLEELERQKRKLKVKL